MFNKFASARYTSPITVSAFGSVSALALVTGSVGLSLVPGQATAQCTFSGETQTCSGDVSAGIPSLTDPTTTLIIENTTTVLGGNIIAGGSNFAGVDVNVDADFSPQGFVNTSTTERDFRVGVSLFATGGDLNVNLTGDATIQAGVDENVVTNSLIHDHFAAVGVFGLNETNLTFGGDLNIDHADLTADSDFITGVDIGGFSGIFADARGPEDAPGDITINHTGDLNLLAGNLTATAIDADGSNRTLVGITTSVDNHGLRGIFATGGGDLDLQNTGVISVDSGTRTARTSSIGGRAEAIAGNPDTAGIGLTRSLTADGALLEREEREFDNVFLRQTGDVTVTIGDALIEAISETAIGGPASEALVQQSGFFNTAWGLQLENGINLDAQIIGDITVSGGTVTATANALAGPDADRGNVVADIGAVDVFGISARSPLDTDRDASSADIVITGDVSAQGGAIEATVSGSGLAIGNSATFPPDPDNSLGVINLFAGDGTGVSISQFGAIENQMSLDNIDLSLSGVISGRGGDVTATLNGSDLPAIVIGGRGNGFIQGFDASRLTTDAATRFEGIGGNVDLTLNGTHGQQQITGGSARGANLSLQSDEDSRFDRDVTALGGNVIVSGQMDDDLSSVVGGVATGLDIGNRLTIFTDEFDQLPQDEQDEIRARQLFVGGQITVTGGDATTPDSAAFTVGGPAVGLIASSGNVTLQGDIVATAGSGETRDGVVLGFATATFGSFFPGAVPLEFIGQTLRIEGSVTATGEGVDVADAMSGPAQPSFNVSETVSAGVRISNLGNTLAVVADGGTVVTNGDGVHGVLGAGEANTFLFETGSSVVANGQDASAVEIRPYHNIGFAFDETQGQGSISSVTVEQGANLSSAQGTGIRDDGRFATSNFDGDEEGNIINITGVVAAPNQTTVDLAGTVSGGNGTAIDLGTGDDRLVIRSTAVANGEIDLGAGVDRLSFEEGFTISGLIDGGSGTDIIEAEVLDGGMRTLDLAPLPFTSFEVIEKSGAGTLVVTGAEITNPTELQVISGLSLVATTQSNLSADISEGGSLFSQSTMAGITNRGDLSVGGAVNAIASDPSIATLELTGDFVQTETGTLNVDIVAPDVSDLITVAGSTELDGNLAVNGLGILSEFMIDDMFTIIDSTGGVTGNFAAITDNLPDLDVASDIVDGNGNSDTVVLTLIPGAPSDKAIIPNSVQSAAYASDVFGDTLLSRAQTAGNTAAGQLSFVAVSKDREGLFGNDIPVFWLSGVGGSRTVQNNGATTGYDADLGGLAFGAEMDHNTATGRLTYGIAGGYSDLDISSGRSSSDVETWHIGVYGVLDQGNLRMSGALSYGFQDYDMTRSIPVGGAFVDANGDADGRVFSASAEVSYNLVDQLGISPENKTRIAPVLRFDHTRARRDSFTETGAGVLDLVVGSDSFSSNSVSLGLDMSTQITAKSGAVIRPSFNINWQHETGDRRVTTNSALVGVNGINFVDRGARASRNRVNIGLGLAVNMSQNVTADFRYDGTFANRYKDHRATASFRLNF